MLHGVSAVVTGASRGIGRAVSAALASAGARIFLISRSEGDLAQAANEIGRGAVAVPCDVTNAGAVARAVRVILQHGAEGPSLLVNNAGVFPLGAIESTEPANFEHTLQANLLAPFRFLHAFVPLMRAAGRGHVITIGSVADRSIYSGNGAYSASKFGARALHEVLREELRGSGIRSTLVAPSATDTPIWDPIDPDNRPGFPPRVSMLRPEDVADAVLWAVTRAPHVNVDEVRISRA
ncbi:SDR family oxidoreductase [Gemmatimonas groenlandica]|uniref:SDR family oxidoreductase n=1 Tax=Gemmatimonas groenlandica TaxID=2732249 RepID=A0A6M4IV02_9BACT|nr:SDR family oxidoreductase [Gemmatimonas groenlandica]QJR36001.1 SDR family oxidoreductase [Gemmatimonas groenlandica]